MRCLSTSCRLSRPCAAAFADVAIFNEETSRLQSVAGDGHGRAPMTEIGSTFGLDFGRAFTYLAYMVIGAARATSFHSVVLSGGGGAFSSTFTAAWAPADFSSGWPAS